jgi:hypothetical protein
VNLSHLPTRRPVNRIAVRRRLNMLRRPLSDRSAAMCGRRIEESLRGGRIRNAWRLWRMVAESPPLRMGRRVLRRRTRVLSHGRGVCSCFCGAAECSCAAGAPWLAPPFFCACRSIVPASTMLHTAHSAIVRDAMLRFLSGYLHPPCVSNLTFRQCL